MKIEYLALLVSITSLVFSIWTGIFAYRATQFRRLSELRTKTTSLYWNMYYRLEDAKINIKQPSTDSPDNIIKRLEQGLINVKKLEIEYKEIYNALSSSIINTRVLSTNRIEELHHYLDTMSISVKVSREELLNK